ncbi:hypothetical protein [Streptomyces sp. NPDC048248]|uniref:hypothetical protein n=1 Tax=Streptomyces sp. NPDC048248 TaxID=3365523 RepID=UPI00371E4C45
MHASDLLRHAAAATVAAGLLTSGAIAMASPASAVGSSACVHSSVPNDTERQRHADAYGISNTSGVNLRTGPGTGYSAKGSLSRFTGMTITCTSSHDRWLYGKVATGANKGKWAGSATSTSASTPNEAPRAG